MNSKFIVRCPGPVKKMNKEKLPASVPWTRDSFLFSVSINLQTHAAAFKATLNQRQPNYNYDNKGHNFIFGIFLKSKYLCMTVMVSRTQDSGDFEFMLLCKKSANF